MQSLLDHIPLPDSDKFSGDPDQIGTIHEYVNDAAPCFHADC